ncbi:hypothetical protein EPN52_03950 [bacterium]|nr:MAG: hypothetical protein EPN52_03950 [bacterium]
MKFSALFLAAGLALAGLVSAAPSSSIGLGLDVTPAKLDISVPAGSSENIPITVHNSSGSGTHVQASMADFTVTGQGQYEFAKVGSMPYSLMRWASINPREFDLPQDTTEQVRLTLAVPAGEKLTGEYAGVVFFQTRPERRKGAISFSARIAAKVYATVPGTVKLSGAIEKVSASASSGGESYRVLFANLGNAHVYLNGRIEVRQNGTTIERVNMPPQLLVERGGKRLIEVTGKALPAGSYQVVAIIDYGGAALTGGEAQIVVH